MTAGSSPSRVMACWTAGRGIPNLSILKYFSYFGSFFNAGLPSPFGIGCEVLLLLLPSPTPTLPDARGEALFASIFERAFLAFSPPGSSTFAAAIGDALLASMAESAFVGSFFAPSSSREEQVSPEAAAAGDAPLLAIMAISAFLGSSSGSSSAASSSRSSLFVAAAGIGGGGAMRFCSMAVKFAFFDPAASSLVRCSVTSEG
mmetsp:Transcript_10002/g.21638  ORF Transcript_10002/g.21638 Transcript_10002/m.21638 type:complete len:203 (-) Transcript_10002:472-1080(-)